MRMRNVVTAVDPTITYALKSFNRGIQCSEGSVQSSFDSNRLHVKLLVNAIAPNNMRTRESGVKKKLEQSTRITIPGNTGVTKCLR